MKKIIGSVAVTALMAMSAMALEVPANHMVDAAWVKAHLGDKDLVLVDVRKKGYDKGHIKGAVHWGKKDFREGRYYSKITKKAIPGYLGAPLTVERTMKKSGITPNSVVVFYGGGTKAKDFRDAALAMYTVEFYGFNNDALLNGGFAGWQKAGGAVETEKTRPAKSDYKITKFNQGVIATGEDVDEAVWTGAYQTVDTNGKGKHWDGVAGIDPRRAKEGHLPGAKAMHPKVLAAAKDGVFYLKDKAGVLAEYEKAGIDPAKPVIWYCNTGHLAAGTWFVQKYIVGMEDGKNRVYSGSMADYTRWPKRKLVKGDAPQKSQSTDQTKSSAAPMPISGPAIKFEGC